MKPRTSEKGNSSPRSRARLILVVTLLLLTVCVVGASFWWQHYKTTPAYSVALLIDAAARSDTAALDKLFDSNQVVDNFVTNLTQNTGQGFSSDLHVLIRRGLQAASPGVMDRVKAAVREGLRRRINELGQSSSNVPFVFKAIALYFKTDIKFIGDKAIVTIRRDNQTLELGMVRDNDHWRVITAKDDALAAQIMTNMAQELPNKLSPTELAKPLTDSLPALPLVP